MFVDEVANRKRKPTAPGESVALVDVSDDDLGAVPGIKVFVRIVAIALVLDEHRRVMQLANVVVVRADADEQGVGADLRRGALGERGDQQ